MLSVGDALGRQGCVGLVDQGAGLRPAPVIAGHWAGGLVVYGSVMLGRKPSVVILLRKLLSREA